MTKSKKITKKYDLSRSAIVERISDIISSLSDLDTYATSPSDVQDEISDVVESLEQLQTEVTDEAW